MKYSDYQLDALKQLQGAVEYLNDVGLAVKSCMRQGSGLIYIVGKEEEYYDDELSSEYIEGLIENKGDE